MINVSARVNAKINQRPGRGVSIPEVEEACDRIQSARWAATAEGNWRLLLKGRTESGRLLAVVLWPTTTEGVWNLATAFPVS